MLIGLLAALSASAAGGMRIGIPLLVIGLLRTQQLWSDLPLLAYIQPQLLIGVLTSWSLFELLGSKRLLGQRIIQLIQLFFSPIVGGIMGIAVVKMTHIPIPLWLIGIVGGILALVLKLVHVGWFFRLRGIPIWVVLLEDFLCTFLVLFAFKAPENGGLIAMLLLWLAIRSSTEWRRWYLEKKRPNNER
ncbi:MAG: DUF4126 domain-containing protein [Gomphosphaeria aponina SAG 52.96 = DSM 107014]|uniref:DUF4126 domain-containing protein n=1 Tax=Gomphosphaeria aponina SAG 52.96 = DSM 107014 TaxID=1521640 RepID=A0A941GQ89_9CHRO|nr:DUF4126 domain-containing protein [Gomphosphaeria aponina SAG 52.96 = DSM 107014]